MNILFKYFLRVLVHGDVEMYRRDTVFVDSISSEMFPCDVTRAARLAGRHAPGRGGKDEALPAPMGPEWRGA